MGWKYWGGSDRTAAKKRKKPAEKCPTEIDLSQQQKRLKKTKKAIPAGLGKPSR